MKCNDLLISVFEMPTSKVSTLNDVTLVAESNRVYEQIYSMDSLNDENSDEAELEAEHFPLIEQLEMKLQERGLAYQDLVEKNASMQSKIDKLEIEQTEKIN